MKVLGGGLDISNAMAMMDNSRQKDDALQELLDIAIDDSAASDVIRRYGKSRDEIEKLYVTLTMSGAGQWEKGAYVAAAALCSRQTMEFLLWAQEAPLTSGANQQDRWITISFKLLEYYESGKAGEVMPRGETFP